MGRVLSLGHSILTLAKPIRGPTIEEEVKNKNSTIRHNRPCVLGPIWISSIMDRVVASLRVAIEALINGDSDAARHAVMSIPVKAILAERKRKYAAVWGQGGIGRQYKRPNGQAVRDCIRQSVIREIFERDRYTCRYKHCQRKTVAPSVLRLLATAIPDVLQYNRSWRPLEQHVLFWVYTTSLEHVVPFTCGGTSERSNLITSCYECNDIKNYLPIEVLGWDIAEPPDESWAGLTEYEAALKRCLSEPRYGGQLTE